MPIYDPRLISNAIQNLESEIQRFTDTSTGTSQQANILQTIYRERAERGLRWSAIVRDRSQNDTIAVREVHEAVDRLLIQCDNAVGTARQTIFDSEKIRSRAIATQSRWQGELEKALQWEAKAHRELQQAIVFKNESEALVHAASNELSHAQGTLRSCNSDSKRQCWSESAAVGAADHKLNAARTQLARAEKQVYAAEQELARAEARVHKCQESLKIANQAVQKSHQALGIANDSLARAESSLIDANAAKKTLVTAQARSTTAEEFAHEAVQRSRSAELQVDTAQTHLSQSVTSNDAAHGLAIRAKLDLDYRNEQLRDFNRVSNEIS